MEGYHGPPFGCFVRGQSGVLERGEREMMSWLRVVAVVVAGVDADVVGVGVVVVGVC